MTRLARTLEARDIETQVASALEHRGGLGEAANLSLTFDRDVQTMQVTDASNSGALQPALARFDRRSGRFDVTFEIANEGGGAPTEAALYRHRGRGPSRPRYWPAASNATKS